MNADGLPPPDDPFADRLAAWEESPGRTVDLGAEAGLAPELRRRLEQGRECVRRLRSWGATRAGAGAGSADRPPRIGRFRVRRELGRGGYGVVFLAYDPRLGRRVALKVPRADALASAELRDRFRQEARAAAGLDHPNIVSVYEAGAAGPVCYIASAYCPGVTLRDWLRRRRAPVPFPAAAGLVAALADGVQHAHERGVVHRDLKPANILLQKSRAPNPPSQAGTEPGWDGGSGARDFTPKITDFGLAKFTAAGEGPTRTGAILGTPSYMAPEQAGGKARTAGPAADVYALGAILYELLTGRPPFVGETDLDTLQQVSAADPVPPRRLRPKAPRDLETVCLKCLEKDPARRYESAAALAADLRRYLAGEPVRARPVGLSGRLWRRARRRPLVAGLLAALALALALGVAGVTWQWRRAEARGDQVREAYAAAVADQARAEASLREALGAVDGFFTRVSEARLVDKPGLQPLRRQLLEDGLAYYRRLLAAHGDDPALRAEIAKGYCRIGSIANDLGDRAGALAAYATARDRLADLVAAAPDDPDLASALGNAWHSLGVLESRSDRQAEAGRCFDAARAVLARLTAAHPGRAKDRSALANSWHSIGVLHTYAGRSADALNAYRQALALLEPLTRDDPAPPHLKDLATTYYSLGALHSGTAGQPAEALRWFRQARGVWERLARADPAALDPQSGLAVTDQSIGLMYRRAGRLADALRAHEQAITALEKLAGANPSVVRYRAALALALDHAGMAQRDLGRPADGRPRQERSCALWAELVAADPDNLLFRSDYGGALSNLGTTQERLGRLGEARATYLRALAQTRYAFQRMPQNPIHREYLNRQLWKLGKAERALGRPVAAAAAARERLTLWPGNPNELYGAAHDLALCVPLVRAEERPALIDETMAALRQAVAAGFADAERLWKEPAFSPLRGRDDFAELVCGLDRPKSIPGKR